jgi:hypothetical protein
MLGKYMTKSGHYVGTRFYKATKKTKKLRYNKNWQREREEVESSASSIIIAVLSKKYIKIN